MVTTIFNTSNLFFIFIAYFFSYSSTQIISSLIVWRNQINNDKTEPGVTSYGKHLSVMQGATVIANNIDKILLFQFTGPAILAGYYLALVPFKQIKNFLSALNVLALPKLSSQKVSDIKVNLPPKLIKSYLLIVPIVLSYIILAPFFFKILFPNYVDFVFISQLFSLMLLFTPTTLLNTALTALEFKKQLYIVSTSTAILRVLLLLIAVPLWGLTGAVSVVIISQTYTAICLVFLFWKIEPPEPTGAVLQ